VGVLVRTSKALQETRGGESIRMTGWGGSNGTLALEGDPSDYQIPFPQERGSAWVTRSWEILTEGSDERMGGSDLGEKHGREGK